MHEICTTKFPDPFKCPTKEEYLIQLLALLPRGRAWQSHEDASAAVIQRFEDYVAVTGEAQTGDAMVGQEGYRVARTVLSAYWAAYAEICEYVSARACKLLAEFFCASLDETFDWWSIDYGFPDPCDPWNDLCEKVAAQGGASCAYITWAASRRGWSIICSDCGSAQAQAVAGCAYAGQWTSTCYDCQANTINIVVDVLNSPAYVVFNNPAVAGCCRVGCVSLCAPNIQQVECLIERVKPAHVQAVYTYLTVRRLKARGLVVSDLELGEPQMYHNPLTANGIDLNTDEDALVIELGTPTLTEN